MANSSEIMQITTTCDVCRNILDHIQNKCETLDDAEKYIKKMLNNAVLTGNKKGIAMMVND